MGRGCHGLCLPLIHPLNSNTLYNPIFTIWSLHDRNHQLLWLSLAMSWMCPMVQLLPNNGRFRNMKSFTFWKWVPETQWFDEPMMNLLFWLKLNDLMNQQWICCFSYFVSCWYWFSPLCWCFVHELWLLISFSSRFTLTWFRYCYQDDCTKEDPLSQDSFRKLALPLPYSKQHHSKLVCYITKELMDTENPPMVLPNGYVYSTKVCIILMSSKSLFGIDFEKG